MVKRDEEELARLEKERESQYRVITEETFEHSNGAKVMRYGDKFDPLYGGQIIELTPQDIDELKKGNVLCWDNEEYYTLVRLEPQV